MNVKEKLLKHFDFLYASQSNKGRIDYLLSKIEDCQKIGFHKKPGWSEEDIILITYGDSILKSGEKPLQTLHSFLSTYLKNEIKIVHILPFFPYSSDDGFSVIDYRQVDPNLGGWDDISEIGKEYNLMFDLVINHVSQQSQWFQNYLQDVSPGKDYFIEVDPNTDLTKVVRPRSLPLLTKFTTAAGEKYVWTTFSADQIDLNFKNPEVLVEMLDILIFYIQNGAKIIRLDAIAFLWKEIGSNCLHLPQTHEVVRLMRTVAEVVDPSVIILTETNVPNAENLSYFGNGDEAHMVYQFSLPPLLLYTLYSGNSGYLNSWAQTLPEIPTGCTFFNFTASHDGIGVRPLEGLLPREKLENLIEGMKSFGSLVNTRQNSDGSTSVYELNITYFDALKGTALGADGFQDARFICSQTIMMALKGIPAFYIHSLLATRNYMEGVEKTHSNRSINRRKCNLDELVRVLNSNTHHSRVLKEIKRRIGIRQLECAFHPDADQKVFDAGSSFFIVSRDNGKLVSVSNISLVPKKINLADFFPPGIDLSNILSGNLYHSDQTIEILPYQTFWLKQQKSRNK